MHARISTVALIILSLATVVRGDPTSRPVAPATQPAPLSAGSHLRRLTVDGRARSYWLHIPPGYDPQKPAPVVLVFHGAFMNGALMQAYCGIDDRADASGFITVYPNGVGIAEEALFFNAWAEAGPVGKGPPDDVAFTARILDDVESVANVDAKRVFATGISNGGMMCYRLAAELSDRIAAIAPVSGTIAFEHYQFHRPVSIIHFHGTADHTVPFTGSAARNLKIVDFSSVDDSIHTWLKRDGIPDRPESTDLPDTAHDGTTVHRDIYGPGKDGSQVILYTITNGGHAWPGRPMPIKRLGKATMNISANDLIWDFFAAHPMK